MAILMCVLCVALVFADFRQGHAMAAELDVPVELEVGRSVQRRAIVVYKFGDGPSKRALVGGIHGGYEWNTVELMSKTLAYLGDNPAAVPDHVTLYVLPMMNPDGYYAGTDRVKGRTNANRVDLNRNWDYQWRRDAFHGQWPISGGQSAFSEPETRAVRDFIMNEKVGAVVFYHSAFAAVFAGANPDLSRTVELAQVVAKATGYPYRPQGMPGQVTTGDSIDWLTGQGVDAIEVELTNHTGIEWERNLRGVRAFLAWDAPEQARLKSIE